MNILKSFISLALANALLLIMLIGWGPRIKQSMIGTPTDSQIVTVNISPTLTVTPVPTKTPKIRVVHVPRPTTGAKTVSSSSQASTSNVSAPSNTSAPTPTSAPQTQDTRCLIKIDGSIYDVTAFRSAHSGGNVFTCGADMSQVFWSKHGKSMLDYMARFRV